MLIKNTTLEYPVLKLLSMGKKSKDKLLLILDDTLIKKPFSQKMVGAWYFFDNKILRSIRAYTLLIAAVSDGKYIIPLRCTFMFAKELFKDAIESKDSIVISIVKAILKIFPPALRPKGRQMARTIIATWHASSHHSSSPY